MKRFYGITILGLAAALAGCRQFPNPFEGERVLARAGKETLHEMDLAAVLPVSIAGEDSVKWVAGYVDRWVRDNLKLAEATEMFAGDEADEELVKVYRNSLVTRRLDEHFIKRAVGDSLYTDKDLRDYYNSHLAEFALDRTIVKGRVVALRSNFRQKARLRELMGSWTQAAAAEAQVMASKNGFTLTEVVTWMEWPQFLALLPTRRNASYDNLPDVQGVQTMTDGDMTWWFVVSDRRVAGATAPYETVSDIVRQSVATRRRAEIIKASEDSIYRRALAEKRAVINLE
jgi:hypothetical protein